MSSLVSSPSSSSSSSSSSRAPRAELASPLLAHPFREEDSSAGGVNYLAAAESSNSTSFAPAFDAQAYARRNQHRAPVVLEEEEARRSNLPASSFHASAASTDNADYLQPYPILHKQMWTNLVEVSADPAHNGSIDLSPSSSSKLWQAWPGNNRPILGGRCLCGPDQGVIGFNVFLILTLSTIFHVWVAPRLHGVVILGGVLLVLLTLYSLAKATWTEAGIVPRMSFQVLQHSYARLPLLPEGVRVAEIDGSHLRLIPPTSLEVPSAPYEVDPHTGEKNQLKFCTTCRIYRPTRAKHCRDCDNCGTSPPFETLRWRGVERFFLSTREGG